MQMPPWVVQRFSLASPSSPDGRVGGHVLHTHLPPSQVHWVAPKKQGLGAPAAAVQALAAMGCWAGQDAEAPLSLAP